MFFTRRAPNQNGAECTDCVRAGKRKNRCDRRSDTLRSRFPQRRLLQPFDNYRLSKATLATNMACMKHQGKATQAALKLIFWTLVGLLAITAIGILGALVGTLVAASAGFLFCIWVSFALFCLWFFRDPNPNVPMAAAAIVAPAHGQVDLIDDTAEPEFMAGACKRISIFLSVIEVH